MSAIKQMLWQWQEKINETAMDGSDCPENYQVNSVDRTYEIWFLGDAGLDSDVIAADCLEEAWAIAHGTYGKSVVEVRGDANQ